MLFLAHGCQKDRERDRQSMAINHDSVRLGLSARSSRTISESEAQHRHASERAHSAACTACAVGAVIYRESALRRPISRTHVTNTRRGGGKVRRVAFEIERMRVSARLKPIQWGAT